MTTREPPSLRDRMRRMTAGLERDELVDSFSDGRLGWLMRFPGHVQGRNTRMSPSHEVTQMLVNAFAYAKYEEVHGDYAEFGVAKGRTFVEAYRVARRFPGFDRRFYAFDSFAGLPDIGEVDAGYRWREGQFAHGRQGFEARLRRARIPSSDVTIVEGFYDETLRHPERLDDHRVAVAWVDCDLYESTVPVLDYLTDRLSPGAVLAFDDWFCFRGARDKGEARACDEWLERNPHIALVPWRPFHWAGQSFLVQLTHH
jgi:O-methyltransferase